MVDFQSRDHGRDADDEDEADETTPADTTDSESTAEPEHASESDHGHADHDHDHDHGFDEGLLGVAVVTVSSTRTLEDDPSGDIIEAAVEAADHEVVCRELRNDDIDSVQSTVATLTGRDDVDVVVLTGGTGVTPDDVTVEGVEPLYDKALPGFGELFRSLSFEQVGTSIVTTRASAGIVDQVPVFCLPGSEDAVRLGTEEIIVEEMDHLAGLTGRA